MKNDAVIKGVIPKRGMYLVHRVLIKTQGRVVRNSTEGVVWWSNGSGVRVRSNPDNLRENGYEWSDAPLADYVLKKPFPFEEDYPEVEPEPLDLATGEAAALVAAEKGETARAVAIFKAVGNDIAAELCAKMPSEWGA